MKKKFDYSTVPANFMHCINKQCMRSNECVRYKVMDYANSAQVRVIILNPNHITADGEDCNFFFPDCKKRYALGITNLLDNIPNSKTPDIKRRLYGYFTRTTYYRIRNKERLITPTEQNFIRQLFLDKGIGEEPVFDEYVEKYEWSKEIKDSDSNFSY